MTVRIIIGDSREQLKLLPAESVHCIVTSPPYFGLRQHAGFNDRWDAMERTEQQAKPATMRNVWFVAPAQFKEAHYAVMPDEIARRCILAGCPDGGTVLDPFFGAGTTGLVADRFGRNCIGIELNPKNAAMARRRIDNDAPLFAAE